MMLPLRLASLALALAFCVSCGALSYPEPEPERPRVAKPTAAPTRPPPPARSSRPVPATGGPLSWSDLTRAAREHQQQGELDAARERLEQAALQVNALPPTNAQRRTVLGMQARLAEVLAAHGEIEAADVLADEVFDQVEREPELGGAALISLALSVAHWREAAAIERGETISVLPYLRIALDVAQTRSVSRDRKGLAMMISTVAYEEDDLPLARRAIDQAIEDSRLLSPTRERERAQLEIGRARIAFAQGDLEAAEASATTSNQIHAELEAEASLQARGEVLLAEILAIRGELERARLIALGAYARLELDEDLDAHTRRRIVAALARVERASGDLVSARGRFEEALSIEGLDDPQDRELVGDLTRELQELGGPVVPSLPE